MEKEKRTLTNDGYITIYRKGRTLREHRWIMEQHLNRPLTRHEHVHHINGVKDDNRIENLRLVSPRDHSMIHHPQLFNGGGLRKRKKERADLTPPRELPLALIYEYKDLGVKRLAIMFRCSEKEIKKALRTKVK